MTNAATHRESCQECKFRHEMECRRFPPGWTVVMVPMPGNVANPRPGIAPSPVSGFPVVNPPAKLWCGEWRPKLEVMQ